MGLMDLYKTITNPLDDPNIMNALLQRYSSEDQFYQSLIKEEGKAYFITADREQFVVEMFNKWKKNIVNMSFERYKALLASGVVKEDFEKMRMFLKTYPDAKTLNDVNGIYDACKNNIELVDIIEKYFWRDSYSDWFHITSNRIDMANFKNLGKTAHRLYINIPTTIMDKVAKELVHMYEEIGMPYYFKYMTYEVRTDQLVIYSSTEYLAKNIEVIEKLNKKFQLESKCGKPPILSGKINSWLGYGSEPLKINGKKTSFNEKRAKLIEAAFEVETKNFIQNNFDKTITVAGKSTKVLEFFVRCIVQNLINYQTKRYFSKKDDFQSAAKRQNSVFNEMDVVKKVGYSLSDIGSLKYQNSIFQLIYNYLLPRVLKGNFEGDIEIPLLYDRTHTITSYSLKQELRKFSKYIPTFDPNYLTRVKDKIISRTKANGIDSSNFSFDTDKIEAMKEYDRINNPKIKIYLSNKNMYLKPDVASQYKLNTLLVFKNYVGLPLQEFRRLDYSMCEFIQCDFPIPDLTLYKILDEYYLDELAAASINLKSVNKSLHGKILLTKEELDILQSFYKIKVLDYSYGTLDTTLPNDGVKLGV